MYSLGDYDYNLPAAYIAQKPADQRDRSRLLELECKTGNLSHHLFFEIYNLLTADDVLVINDTEVIPAKLMGHKETGGKAEVLILDFAAASEGKSSAGMHFSECLIKASKPCRSGTRIYFPSGLIAEILGFHEGIYSVKFLFEGNFTNILCQIGKTPLPPYIKHRNGNNDKANYQTVFASQKGAVAAPTAGFHFTDELLEKLKLKGIQIVNITLHVGYGTFLPVRVSDIREHKIHSEWYAITAETAGIINRAKNSGKRIVAAGTTSVRTLEYASDAEGMVSPGRGRCDLFIYPGYAFKVVDAMITNFHLPQSTLLMLVSAFAGRERIMTAYAAAIKNKYRFYSYGDAMFIH
ncbi:tRNA preQ1(34) S-adenosylmethionine ribosyltransferase-isomerase QueA [Thermodesulfobacteriota bacterium]